MKSLQIFVLSLFCLVCYSQTTSETLFRENHRKAHQIFSSIKQGDKTSLWKNLIGAKLENGSKKTINSFIDHNLSKKDKVYMIYHVSDIDNDGLFELNICAFKYIADSLLGDIGDYYFILKAQTSFHQKKQLLEVKSYSIISEKNQLENWWYEFFKKYTQNKDYTKHKLPLPPPPPPPSAIAKRNRWNKYLTKKEKKARSGYNFLESFTDDGLYVVRIFHPEKKQITFLKSYLSEKKNTLHGGFTSWADNGNKISTGNYKNGKKHGFWSYFSPRKGHVTSEGAYKNGKIDGTWKNYNSRGKLWSKTEWKDGKKDGFRTEYDSLGIEMNIYLYRDDSINEIIKEAHIPKDSTTIFVETLPYLKQFEAILDIQERKKASDNALLKHIYKKIVYPSYARENNVEGRAIIQFTIIEDGSLRDVYVISGICESIEKECIRVLNSLPPWNPGFQNDKAVRVKMNIPIKFRLN